MAHDRKIKLAIVGTTGLPACYGGFETLAHHLVDQLRDEYEIIVYCSSKFYPPSKRIKFFNGARLKYFNLNANGYQSIPYDFLSLLHALFFSEAIIMLGVSGALLIPFIKLFSRKPLIVNIDGLEWKRAKWKKPVRKFLKWSESIAVRFSDNVITDNVAIYYYVKEEYGRESVVIEYGADHTSPIPVTPEAIEKYPFITSPYSFTVCRIEPENNIHVILEAFAANKEKTLVIVGLWTHGEYGHSLKEKYSGYENIHLIDPIYEQKELNILRSNCSYYVHGHSAGGTNPSLVEAMYLGLPVIAFGVSYNRETTEGKAKYFDNGNELINILSSITEQERIHIAGEMKSIAIRRYLWHIIAGKYREQIETAAAINYKPIPELSLQFTTGSMSSYYELNETETF
jgi:glycosyltransferase involved in cell wall biosynthesis